MKSSTLFSMGSGAKENGKHISGDAAGHRRRTVEELLVVRKTDTHVFVADAEDLWIPRGAKGLFGGQVIGQALIAAAESVPSPYSASSVHCYFVSRGDTRGDITYQVESIRNGSSFHTRSVEGRQNGNVILKMMAQFHAFEKGSPYLTYSQPMPEVEYQPEELASYETIVARIASEDDTLLASFREFLRKYSGDYLPVDRRPVADFGLIQRGDGIQENKKARLRDTTKRVWPSVDKPSDEMYRMATRQFWLRPRNGVSTNKTAHKSVLAYMSDLNILATALEPAGGLYYANIPALTSLDHTLYFHEPNVRADEWLLFDMKCLISSHARALCVSQIFTRDGILVCTAIQEGLIRLGNPPMRVLHKPSLEISLNRERKDHNNSNDDVHHQPTNSSSKL
uniref:Acyl-CoA thioesterase n=1 Tax=Perkinsus olseni TaxID=32597 RepID=A0A2K8DNR5_PEROL|nr:Acyl-CoA thioesterase [Perkinsus olseni]